MITIRHGRTSNCSTPGPAHCHIGCFHLFDLYPLRTNGRALARYRRVTVNICHASACPPCLDASLDCDQESRSQPGHAWDFSGLFLAVHFATWISSLEYTSVASSVVFVATGPLWVALLSPMLLNEKLTCAAIVGLALALLGGTVIGLSDACVVRNGFHCPELRHIMEGRAMWGNFLALAGAWAVTGYLIIGRKLRATMPLIPYIFMVYGIAALMLIIIMFAAGKSPMGYPLQTYGWIFLLAAVPQLIGHSTYNWALGYLPAAFVAVATLGEPIGSAVLAYFILKETPGIAILMGGLLILFGIYLASRKP